MRKLTLLAWLLTCGFAQAADVWQPMSGKDTTQALTDRKLQYAQAWQEFRRSGRTLFNTGDDSWGYWGVKSDQYCSMWQPSDVWACYDMARSGVRLRFIGAAGDTAGAFDADD
ncbi:MAG: hypothetical protein WBV71_19715 [Roseobacter sp.]